MFRSEHGVECCCYQELPGAFKRVFPGAVMKEHRFNRYIIKQPFHKLTVKHVLECRHPSHWFTSINLRDAKFHIPVSSQEKAALNILEVVQHFQTLGFTINWKNPVNLRACGNETTLRAKLSTARLDALN